MTCELVILRAAFVCRMVKPTLSTENRCEI